MNSTALPLSWILGTWKNGKMNGDCNESLQNIDPVHHFAGVCHWRGNYTLCSGTLETALDSGARLPSCTPCFSFTEAHSHPTVSLHHHNIIRIASYAFLLPQIQPFSVHTPQLYSQSNNALYWITASQ